jgi:hypothetical protein
MSYFKSGSSSEVEAVDLIKRNSSGPVKIFAADDGADRRLWWVGQAGDAPSMEATLTTGASHSELALECYLMLLKNPGEIPYHAEQFFVRYLQMLNAGAESPPGSAISEQHEGL